MKPLLLVDIDGVLNCFGLNAELAAETEFERVFEASAYEIRVPLGTSEHFKDLQELFECVWCTSWEGDAWPSIGRELGLDPDWPVVELSEPPAAGIYWGESWKLWHVIETAGERACAWIDDDIGADAFAWSQERREPTLLIRTDPRYGLTAEQVAELREFARRHTRG